MKSNKQKTKSKNDFFFIIHFFYFYSFFKDIKNAKEKYISEIVVNFIDELELFVKNE